MWLPKQRLVPDLFSSTCIYWNRDKLRTDGETAKPGVTKFIMLFEMKQDLKDELLRLGPFIILQYTSSTQLSPTIQIIRGIMRNTALTFSTSSTVKVHHIFHCLGLVEKGSPSPSRLRHHDSLSSCTSGIVEYFSNQLDRINNEGIIYQPVFEK